MSEREDSYHQHSRPHNSRRVSISNFDLEIENYWSPNLERELLLEIKSSQSETQRSGCNFLCLLIGLLALLSIGMSVKADAIAQYLREVAIISLQQVIQLNSQ